MFFFCIFGLFTFKMRNFGSDNFSGAHPKILNALLEANIGHSSAYGEDSYTEKALAAFDSLFGQKVLMLGCFYLYRYILSLFLMERELMRL
jgi:hypothetical protein